MIIRVEVGAVGFADDFVKVHPYECDWKSLWADSEETVEIPTHKQ
jgi:hypothetical protein